MHTGIGGSGSGSKGERRGEETRYQCMGMRHKQGRRAAGAGARLQKGCLSRLRGGGAGAVEQMGCAAAQPSSMSMQSAANWQRTRCMVADKQLGWVNTQQLRSCRCEQSACTCGQSGAGQAAGAAAATAPSGLVLVVRQVCGGSHVLQLLGSDACHTVLGIPAVRHKSGQEQERERSESAQQTSRVTAEQKQR